MPINTQNEEKGQINQGFADSGPFQSIQEDSLNSVNDSFVNQIGIQVTAVNVTTNTKIWQIPVMCVLLIIKTNYLINNSCVICVMRLHVQSLIWFTGVDFVEDILCKINTSVTIA